MLVSAQCDILKTRSKHETNWVGGYYQGKRNAAKFILKQAVQSGAARVVAKEIRRWVDYHKTTDGNQFLPETVG